MEFDSIYSLMLLAEQVKTIALANVLDEDSADSWMYNYREICRQYSSKWHTPLHVVYSLPMEDVLLNYYEDFFQREEPMSLRDYAEFMSLTPEKKALKLAQEAKDEIQTASLQDTIAKIQQESKKAAGQISDLESVLKQMGAISPTAKKAGEIMGGGSFGDVQKAARESFVAPPEAITAKVQYVSEEEMEKILETYDPFRPSTDQPIKKRK